MKVLIACEFSGIVRAAFEEKGHDAWSCDLLPTEKKGNHIQGNVLNILNNGLEREDRTSVGTLSIFGPNILQFDISDRFPLCTLKKHFLEQFLKN